MAKGALRPEDAAVSMFLLCRHFLLKEYRQCGCEQRWIETRSCSLVYDDIRRYILEVIYWRHPITGLDAGCISLFFVLCFEM